MVQEMSHSPAEVTASKENSGSTGTCSKELDIDKLRTFSKSLENLNSETLYSKWKRMRGEGRPRSMSLSTAPNFTRNENANQQGHSQPARKNSFHVLQENVFRPRDWTAGASPMDVIKEHNAMHSQDLNNNNTQDSTSQWEQRRRKRVTLHVPYKQHSPPPADKTDTEEIYGPEIKPANAEKRHKGNGKQVVETTSEMFIKPSQKLRRDYEDCREDQSSPIVAQFVSEDGGSTQMADSVIESVRIEIPPQSRSMPSSPNFLMRKLGTAWDTSESPMEPSGGLNSPVVKDASEMRANNERSKTLQNTFSLGCTYAVISQQSPRANGNSVKPAVKMSNGITKEQRAKLEEEFSKLKKVSLELDKADVEVGRFNKLYTLSEVDTKESLDSQPLRRFSELNNSITARRNSSRSTAKALLENITNGARKTEKERIQQIEKAFEWIRKELAELRAQDKDIMRAFTKIQTGIRKIKLQNALSSEMVEPYEFDIVDNSVDLSASFSYVPIVKDFHTTFPRRASLI